MNTKLAIKAGVAAIALVLATGCTSGLRKDHDDLAAKVNQLANDVAAAKSGADAASASASEASQKASSAQSTANQALNAANQSQACCDATNEKIDRAFKRGQMK